MTISLPRKKIFFYLPDSSLFSEFSVWLLIAANLIPLLGVLFWNWDIFSLMVLYWMETAMIGFYQLIKILITQTLFAVFLIPFFIFHFGMFMKIHFMFIAALFGPPWAKALQDSVPAILNRLLFEEHFWFPALALFISHGVSFFLHGFKKTTDPRFEMMENAIEENIKKGNLDPPPSAAPPYHPTEDWQSTIDSTPAKPLTSGTGKPLTPAQIKMVQALTKFGGNSQDLMLEPYKRVIVMHITIILGGMLSQIMDNHKSAILVMIILKITADIFSHANTHILGNKFSSGDNPAV